MPGPGAGARKTRRACWPWQTAGAPVEEKRKTTACAIFSQFRERGRGVPSSPRASLGQRSAPMVRRRPAQCRRKAGRHYGQGPSSPARETGGRVAEVGEETGARRVLFVTIRQFARAGRWFERIPMKSNRAGTGARQFLVRRDNVPANFRLNMLQGSRGGRCVRGCSAANRIVGHSGDGGSFPFGIPVGEVRRSCRGGEGHIGNPSRFADFLSRLEFRCAS